VSLIGSAFLDLIVVLTVAAFAGLVVVWPRLHGRAPLVILSRAGLLLIVNLLVLLTAATQLNAQYLFFTSWGDLTGAATAATALSRGGQAAQAAQQTVNGSAATAGTSLTPPPAGVTGSGMITYTVRGPRSGLTGRIVVGLPSGYASPVTASTRYPVLETFGGYPGSTQTWIRTMHLGSLMAAAAGAHRIRPALIVSPQVEFPEGNDTECVNGGPGQPQVETWLAEDVPNWIAHTFRVSTARSSWATAGFSAGGWCAGMLAMLHPAQYSAAVVMGGYFHPDFGPFYEPFTPKSPQARRYDLVMLADKKPPPIAMWLETSRADSLSYSSSAALLRATRVPMAVTATVLKHAGHRLSIWQGEVPAVITWLGSNIPGFAALGT
jgi:enterochelin esterase-like enzyme